MKLQEVKKYSECFVCGDKNPIGLQVKFFMDGEIAKAEYIAGNDFQGYKNIFHGGILSALLDEIMIKAIIAKDIFTVTTKMEINFKKPVRIGEKILLTGKILEQKKKIITAEGKACLENGEIVAEAIGKYFVVEKELKEKLEESLERS